MQKLLILLSVICILFSCAPQTDYDCHLKVSQLQSRIDSLEIALKNLKLASAPIKSDTKKTKKRILPKIQKDQSVYASASPAIVTPEPATTVPPVKVTESKPSSYSDRCQAITKKGYQCSRSARSGGYCWQHGG